MPDMREITREIPTLEEDAIEQDGVVILIGKEKLILRVVSIEGDQVTLSLEGAPERITPVAIVSQAIRLDQPIPGAAS